MNRIIISKLFIIVSLIAISASAEAQRRFRVVEYNVENLFDTLHDAGFDDHEFLPDGERAWNTARYWGKLGRLCRAITAAGGEAPADLVGLCEVENDTVVHHLVRRTLLHRLGYDFVMTHSADRRGLDVALLYQPMRFKPLTVHSLHVPYSPDKERPTRDILYVSGLLPMGDTLDVFVCHLPSRRGGAMLTKDYRRRACRLIRASVDSLAAVRKLPLVLVMGDMNDEPDDVSLKNDLRAKNFQHANDKIGERNRNASDIARTSSSLQLFNLTADVKETGGVEGTYMFRGKWNRLDHIIVSGTLLNAVSPLRAIPSTARVLALPMLVEQSGVGEAVKPRRTFQGPVYRGGVSDHLPLVLDFFY